MKNNSKGWVTINYIKGISSKVIKSGTSIPIKTDRKYTIFNYIKSFYQNQYRILRIFISVSKTGTQYIPKLNFICLKPKENNYVFQCSTPNNTYRATFDKTYILNSHFTYINLITCGLGVCTYTIKYRIFLNNEWSDWIIIYNKHNGGNTDLERNSITTTIDKTIEAYKDVNFKIELSVHMDSWYKYNFATTSIIVKGKRYTEFTDTTNGELHYVLIEQ